MRHRTATDLPPRPNPAGVTGPRFAVASLLPILALLPGGVMGTMGAMGQTPSDGEQAYLEVEVATVGVDLRTGAPLALLHADWAQVVPIWIGDVEAQAIARARAGIVVPRPLTHDLLASVVGAMGGSVEEVRVHDLREGTYHGAVLVRIAGELREIDSRPSDALALAVRTGARIRVATRLIEEFPDVEFISAEGDRTIARVRGMTVAVPSEVDRERFGIGEDTPGVLVLHSDTPVGARGVRQGDLVLEVEGRGVESAADFLDAVGGRGAEAPIQMRVVREGEERDVEVPPRRPPTRVS